MSSEQAMSQGLRERAEVGRVTPASASGERRAAVSGPETGNRAVQARGGDAGPQGDGGASALMDPARVGDCRSRWGQLKGRFVDDPATPCTTPTPSSVRCSTGWNGPSAPSAPTWNTAWAMTAPPPRTLGWRSAGTGSSSIGCCPCECRVRHSGLLPTQPLRRVGRLASGGASRPTPFLMKLRVSQMSQMATEVSVWPRFRRLLVSLIPT